MTLWVIRAGAHGERVDFDLHNNVAAIGWEELNEDLRNYADRDQIQNALAAMYPDQKVNTIRTWKSILWRFVHDISIGDLVAMPIKNRAVIFFGTVAGDYNFNPEFPSNSRHNRPVNWIKEIPRNQFPPDILYSFGGLSTVFKVDRNNAENRVKEILERGEVIAPVIAPHPELPEGETFVDLEQFTLDQISSYIIQKFKGHGLARLVAAILEAQGYKVNVSPEGPDGGIDIVAGSGSLGFDAPKIVVQVKSSSSPIEVNVVRELSGVMTNFGADHGLIVSWGGFRGTVEREAARSYFKIRLWDAEDLVRNVQLYYEKLQADIQAELPLKRIWILVNEGEE